MPVVFIIRFEYSLTYTFKKYCLLFLDYICNRHFQLAFTSELDTDIPSKCTSPLTPMGELRLNPNGVQNSY